MPGPVVVVIGTNKQAPECSTHKGCNMSATTNNTALPQIITGTSSLSDMALLILTDRVLVGMTDNPHFAVWPPGVPPLDEVRVDRNNFQVGIIAAQNHDSLKIAERNTLRAILEKKINHLAAFVQMAAHGDADALASSGFELRRPRSSSSSAGSDEPLPAPTDFSVEHGSLSGTLTLHASRPTGARACDIEVAQGDPSVPENWHHWDVSGSWSRITLSGFTPGQVYWLRVRAIGGKTGHGLWSNPIRIMAV